MDNASDTKNTKRSRGRQRIEIKKLEDESKCQVTFSKRRKGLFKKATELSTLCGAEVAVIALAKSGRVYATDSADAVLDRYLADPSDANFFPKQKEGEEDNTEFLLNQSIEKFSVLELLEYAMALNDLKENATARLEELNIQNSTRLWAFVADQDVNKSEFLHQFMFEGNNFKAGFRH